MNHYIDAKLSPDEFRKKFCEIREAFIDTLRQHIEGRNILAYRACDVYSLRQARPLVE